jgi:predicted amidohydrolase
MARCLGIAGIQMEVVHGKDNSEAMIKKLNVVAASFPWVDMVLFSELCVCGLNFDLAQAIPNPTIDRFCEWAMREKKWLILFDIPEKGRFGLCICYDQWFPEVIRTLGWMGAEAIFCPTATTTSDRPLELVLAQANAIANQLYFFSINGIGAGGVGRSIFVDPEGRILQTAGEREIIMTEVVDLDMVSRVREYGTLGLSQLWKDLANFEQKFPVYKEDIRKGEIFESLGPRKLHKKMGD